MLSGLPRFRHRPVAVTDGSLTENLNKTVVRLWTDPSGQMGRNSALSTRHGAVHVGNS